MALAAYSLPPLKLKAMETLSPNIYLVEDDPFYKDIVSRSLLQSHFKVKTFSSASDYLKEINIHKPDLAIIDYKLNDADGLELLRKTKSISSAIKIVILSAQQKMEIVTEAIKNGASFVHKDKFTFSKLRNIARRTAIDLEATRDERSLMIYRIVFVVLFVIVAITLFILHGQYPDMFRHRD
jgi:DNA-binding NtrC family response regulator